MHLLVNLIKKWAYEDTISPQKSKTVTENSYSKEQLEKSRWA